MPSSSLKKRTCHTTVRASSRVLRAGYTNTRIKEADWSAVVPTVMFDQSTSLIRRINLNFELKQWARAGFPNAKVKLTWDKKLIGGVTTSQSIRFLILHEVTLLVRCKTWPHKRRRLPFFLVIFQQTEQWRQIDSGVNVFCCHLELKMTILFDTKRLIN